MNLDHELERLATAEKHIADAEKHLAELIQQANELREHGKSVESVTNAIAAVDATLIEWRAQRDLISERMRNAKA